MFLKEQGKIPLNSIPSFKFNAILQQKLRPPFRTAVFTDRPKIMYMRTGYFHVFQFIFVGICSFVLSAGTRLEISRTRHQRFKQVCRRKNYKVRKFHPSTFYP